MEEEEGKLFARMLDGIAFLPLGDVNEGIQFLRDNTPAGKGGCFKRLTYINYTMYVTAMLSIPVNPLGFYKGHLALSHSFTKLWVFRS